MDIAGLGRGSGAVPHAYRSRSRSERPVQPRSGGDRSVDGVLDCLAVAGKKTAASRHIVIVGGQAGGCAKLRLNPLDYSKLMDDC